MQNDGTSAESVLVPASEQPRPLDRVRMALRVRHYSLRTEKTYIAWIRRYILFHGKRHPVEIGAEEVTVFLCRCGGRGVRSRVDSL